jgi:hypothetical protein
MTNLSLLLKEKWYIDVKLLLNRNQKLILLELHSNISTIVVTSNF